jgi:NADP-dependent alcohol dehydrogenase
MNNFEFCNPVKVVFGKGTIVRLPALIPEDSKVLVVYGGGSIRKNGIYEQVADALKSFQWLEFSGIEANPHMVG